MQDIVQEALDNAEQEKREMDAAEGDFGDPRIVIVGCGGAGNNTVNRLYNIGVDGAETVAINTDKQHLKMIEADTKILVGKSLTNGLGAGGDPSMGERATEMAQGTIKDVLGDADLVFVTAGMGGGTGTGAAPVVADLAKEQGAIVVAMVSTPFNVERARTVKAEEGLEKLRDEADSIIVLDNNRLLDYVPNLPIGKAFSVMDQIIAETVKGISETITQPSLIN
ncbi:cell division protein FtsZ, partial [Halobacteriales archaeon QS_1_68_17]